MHHGPGRHRHRLVAGLAALAISAALPCAAQSAEPATTRTLPRDTVIARFDAPASRHMDVNGIDVHYQDEGSGPVVLLVHGTFGDLADWDGWAAKLRARYRVVRLDLPGFGTTGRVPSGNYSVDRQLGLVDALMDKLGAERFAVVGVSYGGLVAFRYAATRVERVSALVLINSAGIEFGGSRTDEPGPKPRRDLLTSASITRNEANGFLLYMIGDDARVTTAMVDRKLAYANTAGRQEEAQLALKQYERADPARVLAHVQAPVLVMWGGRNRVLTANTADAFTTLLKNARSTRQIVYPQGAHLLNLQIPDETAADACAFFDTTLRPAADAPLCNPSPASR